MNEIEEIIVDYLFEQRENNGDATLYAFAIDGRILLLTTPNPAKLAELKKAISDESKQEDYSEWLRRQGNRTPDRSSD